MNSAPLTLLLAVALASGWLSARSAETPRLPPRDYQRLDDWARQHGFTVSRAPGSRDVVVAGGSTRIEMQVDSSRIEVNQVGVWLSNPVTANDQQVFLAAQDLRSVLDALFSPRRLPPGKKLRVICLDPGHGGRDPGQRSGNRFEKQYTLLLAEEVRERLVQAGFQVVLTRRDDSYPELPERMEIARRHGADLFVSLHFNAAADGGSEASGVEVYAMTPEGSRSTNLSNDLGSLRAGAGNAFDFENLHLAFQLQKSILRSLPGIEDRGVRRARFVVLRLAEMPAVVVESGFMSNASDARWIYSLTGRRRLAQAIVDGVANYRRLVERPALASAPKVPEKSGRTASATPSAPTRPRTNETSLAATPRRVGPTAPKPVPPVTIALPERAAPEPSTPKDDPASAPSRETNAPGPSAPPPSSTNAVSISLPPLPAPQRSTNSKSSSTNEVPDSPKN